MTQNLRKIAVAAGLAAMAIASSANAAVANLDTYTYSFKTFYDTSTISNTFDTKTLDYSVASLTISNNKNANGLITGVTVKLTENVTAFPARNSTGTLIDALWLNGTWGTVAGGGVSGGGNLFGLPTFRDGAYVYNGNVNFASTGVTEGNSATFTITGSGVTAYNFAKSGNVPMIELSNVGGIYDTYVDPFKLIPISGGKVSFIGNLPPAIPEPSTYALMGLGLVGVAFVSRRARRAA